jgi:Tfp pilus assembly protein PilN
MFLYGGSSNIKNIEEYFEASFNIDTRIVKDIKHIKLNEKTLNSSYYRTSDYLNAVAGLYQRKEDINLLSDLIEVKRNRLKKVAGITLAAGAIVTFGALYFIGTNYRINSLENEIENANNILENEVYRQKLTELEQLKTRISILEEYKNNIFLLNKGIMRSDFVNVEILNAIADNVPIDTEMSNLNISNNNIVFNATSRTRTSIAQLEKNLKELYFISDVHIPGIVKNSEGEVITYSYSVSCVVDGGYLNEN